jgi:hypothetical protein
MLAIEFPEQTHILAKDQPQYLPLPVHIDQHDEMVPMTCCFQLTPEELAEINASGGKLWYTQSTFGHPFQPVRMSTQNPFIHKPAEG